MEIVHDYRYTEAWEGLCDSKELYTNIPLVSYVQTLQKMILNRIAPTIEQHLIKEQAGFRPGKSCTSQLLNLTQHIEDDYQESMITGTTFVDHSAAYDIVNHILFNITQDSPLCRTCCQTEDFMWSWTMNEADGDYRRMTCHTGVFSPELFSTYTPMIS